jgi:hypothetical protein
VRLVVSVVRRKCEKAHRLGMIQIVCPAIAVHNRWDEKAGLQRDAISSQVTDALQAQDKETGDEKEYHHCDRTERKIASSELNDRFRPRRSLQLVLRAG